MIHRTLEEYKEDVFEKLDEKTKLEWLYTMSEKLCNIEEYIENNFSNEDGTIWHSDMKIIYDILNKEG
jgi:hypothetical protein